MIRQDNYILIQGWMVSDLKLKGNELSVFAIIYGFSQTTNQYYSGGIEYLAEWVNSTRQGVMKNLKSLLNKGFIEAKKDGKYIKYRVPEHVNKVYLIGKQSLLETGKQSLHNNIIYNNTNIINNIIVYLNEKTGCNFRSTTPKTKALINARLKEGFNYDDFKKVINNKTFEWKDNAKMARYLRPETLFGTKFESYLNERSTEQLPEWFGKDIQKKESELSYEQQRELDEIEREAYKS